MAKIAAGEQNAELSENKQSKAPQWDTPLSPGDIAAVEKRYGTLAVTFQALAGMIEEADRMFRDAANSPHDSTAIHLELGRSLYADYGGKDESWVMAESLATRAIAMRILFSTVNMKPRIEAVAGVPAARRFYEDLQNNLRFFEPQETYTAMSGNQTLTCPVVLRVPAGPGGWAYMGANRKSEDDLTQKLARQVQEWGASLLCRGESPKKGGSGNGSAVQTVGGGVKPVGKDEDFVTVAEVAAFVDKTPGRITQLCNAGKIHHTGKGKDRRVSKTHAALYFANQEAERAAKKDRKAGRDHRRDTEDVVRDERKMNGRNRI